MNSGPRPSSIEILYLIIVVWCCSSRHNTYMIRHGYYDMQMTDALEHRSTRSLSSRGQIRLYPDHWRNYFDDAEEVQYDLINTEDGVEVRLRPV